jgi:carboxylesterase
VPLLPGAEPFSHDGNDVGVLIIHGYTATPLGMKPWAQHLADLGYTVRVPLLPGHGTTYQDLSRTRWQDWYGEAERAFREIASSCRAVVVAGLSMGAAMGLRLAEEHGSDVAGLVLVNPAVLYEDRLLPLLPFVKHFIPTFPAIGNDICKVGEVEQCYDRNPLKAAHSLMQFFREVRRDLPEVTQPLLVFRSRNDHLVPASSSAEVLARVSSNDVREVMLENSYHVATQDNDAPAIFEGTAEFVARVTAPAARTR